MPEQMEIEVELAFQDWESIPTGMIAEFCGVARREAGEFMPTNGFVVKCWEGRKKESMYDTFVSIPGPSTEISQEEKDANAAYIRRIIDSLGRPTP